MQPSTDPIAKNVYGEPLVPCSFEPLTGYFRDGCCKTDADDAGTHVVCAIMTSSFLAFSASRGNDLSTPRPEWRFPGLQHGDQWCLCANRWREAYEAGVAPLVVLESTNQKILEMVPMSVLSGFDSRHP
ncbi:MAG: DUF2237 domain-containing protein [Herminiimonas sp.]|nr:DUF2237 domain-containing protein [Herminiimonas sp.]